MLYGCIHNSVHNNKCDQISENIHSSHIQFFKFVIGFAKRDCMCNYKYLSERFNAVYIKNAWCPFYAILHKSVVCWILTETYLHNSANVLVHQIKVCQMLKY